MNKQSLLSFGILLLFLVLSFGVQGQKVTKNFQAESLKTVLKEIEDQTGFSIMYKTDELNENRKVTASFNDANVEEVLNKVLGRDLSFTIEDKMIVIFNKTNALQASSQPVGIKNKNVSGVISDANGEPLIGVSVRVKGTTQGTTTNFDGEFQLNNVAENAELEITYIGMNPQVISVSGKTHFEVIMRDDDKMLEEVVVTAMGIERKSKSLTYATQKMDNDELMRVQDANFINSLQGKAAGLTITPNAGGAGGSSKILLRGNKSVLGNNTPLIVVDGIPMSNPVANQQGIGGGQAMGYSFTTEGSDALSSINPDDIESINILKGANASALYGSAASNGVLIITTKKGKEGSLSVGLSSNATFERPMILPSLQNTYGARANTTTGSVASDSWGKKMSELTAEELGVKNITDTPQDYIGDFFGTGSTLNNSISISGGSQLVQSYFSYGNTNSNGMIENNHFNRHTISFRQSYNLFKDRLKIDASVNYINENTKNRPGGGTSLNPLFNLYTAPRNIDMNHYRENYVEDGTWMSNPYNYYAKTENGYQWTSETTELEGPKQNWIYTSADQNNPYWLINRINRYSQQERVYGYLSGNVKLLDGLNAQARLSIDRSKRNSRTETSATTQFPATMLDYGEYRQGSSNTNEIYLDWMLNYNEQFGNFAVSASAGYTAHHLAADNFSMIATATVEDAYRRIIPTAVNVFEPWAGLTGGRSYNKTIDWDEGAFFTGQIGYNDYLFLEGSYRRDWYRAFRQFSIHRGTPDNYGYYSLGLNGLVHEMLELPTFWNYLKLRTSYSEVGNSIPNIMYHAVSVNQLTGAVVPSPYSYFQNPIPEKTKSFEAGYDASFFRNALSWDLTFYYTTLNNAYLLIADRGKSKPVNSGVIRNRGVETSLSYAYNIANNMLWKTGINFAYNDNKILSTYRDENDRESLIEQQIGFGGKVQIKYKEGGKYGDLYATDFARNEDGKVILTDEGQPRLSSTKFGKYMGNMNAPYQLGWNNTFTYKDLSLYFLVDGRIGGKVISFTEAYLDLKGLSSRSGDARLAWEANPADLTFTYVDSSDESHSVPGMLLEDGQLTSIENYYRGIGGDINATQYVYDATNFRLREVSLGYTFRNLLGDSKNLSLSVIGRNLFFLYNKTPVDPDTSISTQNSLGSVDVFNMPSTRSLGLALSVTF